MGLAHPILTKTIQKFGTEIYKVGSVEMQGCRSNMEDQHTVLFNFPNHPKISFFGVFDGHDGDSASRYCHEFLHNKLNSITNLHDDKELVKAMCEFDEEFLKNCNKNYSGSTCVFALVEANEITKTFKITIVNIGDSRALIIKQNGELLFETKDHQPSLPSEKSRIEGASGFVQFNRVDGQLAMSRALGDYSFKNQIHLSQIHQKVIPVPDISHFEVSFGDFLFLACDGIFEKLSTSNVVSFLNTQIKTGSDPVTILCDLLDYSLDSGSQDNMTAILIFLGENGLTYKKEKSEIYPGPFFPQSSNESFSKQYINSLLQLTSSNSISQELINSIVDSSRKALYKKIDRFKQDIEDLKKDAEIQKHFIKQQIESNFPENAQKPPGRMFFKPRVDSKTIVKYTSSKLQALSMFVPLDRLSPCQFIISTTKHGFLIGLVEGNLISGTPNLNLSSPFIGSSLSKYINQLEIVSRESLNKCFELLDKDIKEEIQKQKPPSKEADEVHSMPSFFRYVNSNNHPRQDYSYLGFILVQSPPSANETIFPIIGAHVGFIHCIVGKSFSGGGFRCLSNIKSHNPFDTEEKERLNKLGVDLRCYRINYSGEILSTRRVGLSKEEGVIPLPNISDQFVAEPGDFLLLLTGTSEIGPIERIGEFAQQQFVANKFDLHTTMEDIYNFFTQRTSRFHSSFSGILVQIQESFNKSELESFEEIQEEKIFIPGPLYSLQSEAELKEIYMQHAQLEGRALDSSLLRDGYLAEIQYIDRDIQQAEKATLLRIEEANRDLQALENGECERVILATLQSLPTKQE